MKWLAYGVGGLAALIVVGALVLWILGRRENAGRIQHAVEIDKPPSLVFHWVSEPEKMKQWISWLVEIRPLNETPERVGSKEVFVMHDPNNGDQALEMQAETIAFETDKKVGVRVSAEHAFDGTAEYRLTPVGDGKTRLEYDGRFSYQHWFASLMEPLITPQAKDKLVGDMSKLKTLVEAAN